MTVIVFLEKKDKTVDNVSRIDVRGDFVELTAYKGGHCRVYEGTYQFHFVKRLEVR